MDDEAFEPGAPDLSLLLSRSTYWQIVADLQASLPPPPDDTSAARAHRDRAAIAAIGSMLPANAEEARIALRCVIADAQAIEAVRQSRLRPDDFAAMMRCNAWCASMMRQANAARALLARVQTIRRKREADGTALNQDSWIEHAVVGLLAEAMDLPAPEPPPPAPEPEPEDKFRQLTEAEQYAVTYPRRAALIRSLGRLPEPCNFGPPPPELVEAIVTGTSPILLELDRPPSLVPA